MHLYPLSSLTHKQLPYSNKYGFMKSFTSSHKQDHPRDKNDRHTTRMTKSRKEKNIKSPDKTDPVANEIGMIIHEIRNPLTAISLANQSLHEEIGYGHLPPSLYTVTEMIAKNITRIEVLLKELLHANCGQMELAPADICDIIESSLKKADDRIFLKQLEISKSYCRGLFIHANAEKLSLAFLNIIINAIEAAKQGEGRIWITAYRREDSIKIVFKDNGTGMEPDIAAHMFDKNFSGKTNGLGVGLANVKAILDRHNAVIVVNSEQGTGTSFIVTFKAL